MANLSILGLYHAEKTIFDGMQLPEGMEREPFIDLLLAECAELEVLYPQPELMKSLVSSWSKTRLHSWERLYNSTKLEYDPLENYNRFEDWNDTDTGEGTVTSSGGNTEKIAGYDSGSMVDRAQSNASGESTENRDFASTRSGHVHGNIGVTTPFQMLEGERKIYQYDVYSAIVQEFKQRFLLLVY